MPVSRIIHRYLRSLKMIRDRNKYLGDDEGISMSYGDLGDHIGLQISDQHLNLYFSINGRSFCNPIVNHYRLHDTVYEGLCNGFVEPSSKAFVSKAIDAFKAFGCGHFAVDWMDETNEKMLAPMMQAAFDLVKYDTPLTVEYLWPGERLGYSCGSPDTYGYSDAGPDESDEVASALNEVRDGILRHRQAMIESHATRIQSCFRGWRARMDYAFNPNTTLGRFYQLREFNRLLTLSM